MSQIMLTIIELNGMLAQMAVTVSESIANAFRLIGRAKGPLDLKHVWLHHTPCERPGESPLCQTWLSKLSFIEGEYSNPPSTLVIELHDYAARVSWQTFPVTMAMIPCYIETLRLYLNWVNDGPVSEEVKGSLQCLWSTSTTQLRALLTITPLFSLLSHMPLLIWLMLIWSGWYVQASKPTNYCVILLIAFYYLIVEMHL